MTYYDNINKHDYKKYQEIAFIFLCSELKHVDETITQEANYDCLCGVFVAFVQACFCYGGEICYLLLNDRRNINKKRTADKRNELNEIFEKMHVPKKHGKVIIYIAVKWLKWKMKRDLRTLKDMLN